MDTQGECAKSTALGKKCNPSRDPTKRRKGPKSGSVLEAYKIFQATFPTSALNALIFFCFTDKWKHGLAIRYTILGKESRSIRF